MTFFLNQNIKIHPFNIILHTHTDNGAKNVNDANNVHVMLFYWHLNNILIITFA